MRYGGLRSVFSPAKLALLLCDHEQGWHIILAIQSKIGVPHSFGLGGQRLPASLLFCRPDKRQCSMLRIPELLVLIFHDLVGLK